MLAQAPDQSLEGKSNFTSGNRRFPLQFFLAPSLLSYIAFVEAPSPCLEAVCLFSWPEEKVFELLEMMHGKFLQRLAAEGFILPFFKSGQGDVAARLHASLSMTHPQELVAFCLRLSPEQPLRDEGERILELCGLFLEVCDCASRTYVNRHAVTSPWTVEVPGQPDLDWSPTRKERGEGQIVFHKAVLGTSQSVSFLRDFPVCFS